jgi:hypothetical protein
LPALVAYGSSRAAIRALHHSGRARHARIRTRSDSIWNEAITLLAEERPPSHTCFIHRDYQHFDVGHCRLNLTG